MSFLPGLGLIEIERDVRVRDALEERECELLSELTHLYAYAPW